MLLRADTSAREERKQGGRLRGTVGTRGLQVGRAEDKDIKCPYRPSLQT